MVQDLGVETKRLPAPSSESGAGGEGLTFIYTRYAFDFDGPQFAIYMRGELEKQLRRRGTLPPSINLETPVLYQRTTGQGEVWIDGQGLPIRLMVDLAFPRLEKGADQVNAAIKTDLFNYDGKRLTRATTPFVASPAAWLAYHNPFPQTPREWHNAGMRLASWLLIVGVCALVASVGHTRRFYQVIATVIIVSMVGSPLVQASQVSAFAQTQQARQAEQQLQRAEQQAQSDLRAKLRQPNTDPHVGIGGQGLGAYAST